MARTTIRISQNVDNCLQNANRAHQSGRPAHFAGTLDAALVLCDRIARDTTVNFRFGIERAAGWPLINVMAAYEATGNPYYLNGAKLIM